jgi:hypothetical protein
MTDRPTQPVAVDARPRTGSRTALRVRRTVAVLVVLAALAVGADYGAAALTEAAVSRQMRSQMNLADNPSVRFNNFPFLTQAIAGRYRSVDVVANHLALGPLRDVQVRVQLRDAVAPLSLLLGDRPPTIPVREAEGTVRVNASDVERLLTGVDKLWIDRIDAKGLRDAVDDGADPGLLQVAPETAARLGGNVDVLGTEQPVSLIAVVQVTDDRIQVVPRDVRLGGPDAAPLPAAVQRVLTRLFTLRIDPGALPLQVTPTKVRATGGALEISGIAHDLVLGASAPLG